jgi:hypothetical protein
VTLGSVEPQRYNSARVGGSPDGPREGGQQTLSNLAAYVTEIIQKGVED